MQQNRKKKLFFPVIILLLVVLVGGLAMVEVPVPTKQVEQELSSTQFSAQ
jgi:hypothetical protein